MKLLDISEVAARSGLSASTLRYYEEKGLIQSVARHGLRRQYTETTLVQLSMISMAKEAGFELKDISELFDLSAGRSVNRDMLRRQAQNLKEQIARLSALQSALSHAADCPEDSHFECKTFQSLLARGSWLSRSETQS